MWLSDVQSKEIKPPSPLKQSHVEIGVGLTSGGVAFLFLGCILFFDRGLLALGNVHLRVLLPVRLTLFVALVPDGPGDGHRPVESRQFLRQATEVAGNSGLLRWGGAGPPQVHLYRDAHRVLWVHQSLRVVEIFYDHLGTYRSSDFFPVLVGFLRKLPIIGDLLNMPGVGQVQ